MSLRKYFEKVCKRLIEKEYIVSPYDLVGEGRLSRIFPVCSRFLENSLSNDVDIAIPQRGINWRRKTFPMVRKLVPLFISHKQVIEDRYILQGLNYAEKDCGITMPDSPVIYASNHGFYDDVAATISVSKRPVYVVTDGVSDIYNSVSGIALWLLGLILLNNKIKKSRHAVIKKAEKVLRCGTDIIIFPEGVWNKTSNLLVLPLYRGIYRIAKETDAKVVPAIHYLEEPLHGERRSIIHTVVDEPISFAGLEEQEALALLRDRMAYWYYLMMERYGRTTRRELLGGETDAAVVWEAYLRKLVQTAYSYDSELASCGDYRAKEIVRPEQAWVAVANIEKIMPENTAFIAYAKEVVKRAEREDFQRRF